MYLRCLLCLCCTPREILGKLYRQLRGLRTMEAWGFPILIHISHIPLYGISLGLYKPAMLFMIRVVFIYLTATA